MMWPISRFRLFNTMLHHTKYCSRAQVANLTQLKPQIRLLKTWMMSNINAGIAVADVVRTTLGPRGMDKIIKDDKGNTIITNDGATILKLRQISNPAAKVLVDIAKSHHSKVGDGTTTVVILAGQFLKEAIPFIEDGVCVHDLIKNYYTACDLAVANITELAVSIKGRTLEENRRLLAKCAATTLSSKLIGGEKDFVASLVVDAVIGSDRIGIKKVPGGIIHDSFFTNGIAFNKTFPHAGFEQQPQKLETPFILLLNVELELKSEKENAEIRLSDPSKYQSTVDADSELTLIYDKLDKCVNSDAQIVLSRLAIGVLATQYLAEHDIFCVGRVTDEDLHRIAVLTGALVRTSVNNIVYLHLGICETFEAKLVGNEWFYVLCGFTSGHAATIVLRGGADQFIDEVARSLYDAIVTVRLATKNPTVVAGGGAIEMEISQFLSHFARRRTGNFQRYTSCFAKALEIIPSQICENAGFDAANVLTKLRQQHSQRLRSGKGALYGVDIDTGKSTDSFAKSVCDFAFVKIKAIKAATKAACLILSMSETVENPEGSDAANAMGVVEAVVEVRSVED